MSKEIGSRMIIRQEKDLEESNWVVETPENREQSEFEKEYWEAVDRLGPHILPPIPCRKCGEVWEHTVNCE